MLYNYRVRTEDMIFSHPTKEKHEIFINPFIPFWKNGEWFKACSGCKHNKATLTSDSECGNCVRCPYCACGSRTDFYESI